MMGVSLDVSSLAALRERAEQEFSSRGILRRMRPHIDGAALGERSTHLYRNRTGQLEHSTRSIVEVANRDEVRIALVMGMYYAEYVWRSGYSDIDVYAAEARDRIFAEFAAQSLAVTK